MNHNQGHEQGNNKFSNRASAKYHRTNEFSHRASEAMGLDWDNGKKVLSVILRDIIRRISPKTGEDLISNLPLGLKQESYARNMAPLKSIGADTIKRDIEQTLKNDQVDAQAIIRLFWLFLEGELHEGRRSNKGILARVLSELPHDIRTLLTRQENAF